MSNRIEETPFIKDIYLNGYKSIKALSVRLNAGLNIVIGKNGSGKTNFVEFLHYALRRNLLKEELKSPYTFKIQFETNLGATTIEEWFNGQYELEEDGKMEFPIIQSKISDYQGNAIEDNLPVSMLLKPQKAARVLIPIFHPTVIPFTTPSSFGTYMLSELGQISILVTEGGDILNRQYTKALNGVFQENWNHFTSDLNLKESLIEALEKYSPIKNLRLSDGLSINRTEKRVDINYLMLEFFVNDTWLTWQQLSDGTKRIFHIIYEVSNSKKLILIEEPENGVHPEQLYLLMDFLKEQSEHKQIIVTTHSPEVLNILEKEELDRIIITRIEGENGTKMHHLSEKQQKKAIWYMENKGMLSDCWVHSKNFEKYETSNIEA